MKTRSTGILFAMFVAIAFAATTFAQGVQTGTIRGTVKDSQGLAVPGVTVTATSPAMQGSRTVVTDAQGQFTINALPPGAYTVKYTLSGFNDVTRSVSLPLGLIIEQNAVIQPAGVAESVQVTAAIPTPIATSIVGFVKYGWVAGWVGLACVCFLILLVFALRAVFGGLMRLMTRK